MRFDFDYTPDYQKKEKDSNQALNYFVILKIYEKGGIPKTIDPLATFDKNR